MEGSLKLVGYKFSSSTQNVMFAAKHAGAPVTLDNVNWSAQDQRKELKSSTPTGTFPFLTTPQGVISECSAIIQYLAEAYKPELLGANTFEKAQVRQWIEFAGQEITRNSKALIYPLFGFVEFNKEAADAATADLKVQLAVLNKHLEGKSFVVGSNLTLADIHLFGTLRVYFALVLVEDQRKKMYPNITAWFVNIASGEHSLKVFGRTALCKVPLKAHKIEKKEEKKEEKKVEAKPAKKEATEEGDDEEPKKKSKNPLDCLPPTTFILDDFKKEFLNTPDRVGVLKAFWEKYDANGFSIWFMQYQKLASEGKVLFKTCNSSSFFLQKLDPFRKYTFSAHGVYGDEGNYEIRGVWMWKGTEIPEEIKEHDNFPYLTIKRLDTNSEADRKLIENYWLNIKVGDVVDGLAVAEVVHFK